MLTYRKKQKGLSLTKGTLDIDFGSGMFGDRRATTGITDRVW